MSLVPEKAIEKLQEMLDRPDGSMQVVVCDIDGKERERLGATVARVSEHPLELAIMTSPVSRSYATFRACFYKGTNLIASVLYPGATTGASLYIELSVEP